MTGRSGLSPKVRVRAVIGVVALGLAGCAGEQSTSGGSVTASNPSISVLSTTSSTTANSTTFTTTSPTASTTTTQRDCASLIAEYESQIGTEYLGGSTPIPGGTELGGIMIRHSYPPQANIDSGVVIHAFGDCQILALGRLVRYEEVMPVWRLTDVLAMPSVQADEFVHLVCVGVDSDPASNERFFGVMRVTDQTEYRPSLAWRVDPDRGFEAVDPNTVRCPSQGQD